MKKILLSLGVLAVLGSGGYLAYNHYYGTYNEVFACGDNNEVTVTFVKANRDDSMISCHACDSKTCEVGSSIEVCQNTRLVVGFMASIGKCHTL
jgi:hypothetical protein